MKILFGVDIGGTTVKIGCFNECGDVLKKFEIVTDTSNSGKNICKDIASAIEDFMKEKSFASGDVVGIGFGIPGPVLNNFIPVCVNLGWKEVNIEKEFLKHLSFKTKIVSGNDANVAAIGEMWKTKESCQNAILLTLGTGVGAGIVVNGNAVEGFNGAGGELGHAKVDFVYNFKCNCGNVGCLETIASATGVVNVAKHLLKTKKSSLSDLPDFTCKDVFDHAKAGDKVASFVVDEVCKYLGYTCSLYAIATNPELIIIGGGVSKAGNILIEGITKYFKQYAMKIVADTPIVLANLGNDAGIFGASYLVGRK